ncbi:glycosyltransferase family 4 protein [Thiocapsa rosea]|uniref:Glycosyltransferase involved in cell wall biosynthesis n=1 Tax=Thiocapsa rosea TaxID=69360 RepID=A0A495VG63_9GAMM|nr:glycosyltransferase family 4 protein [Thiocapsa rosea]RKT47427.1 glycosyltransferase involved in cell wall biosynthesis [Thiocapsa rosea]
MPKPAGKRKLSTVWIGLRGIPDIMGGVESHAEHICPRLAALGCEVTVVCRSTYSTAHNNKHWRGVNLVTLWAPRSKNLEAITHTVLAVFYAIFKRPDILHIQAVGPALLTPLARLFGLKVVVTNHGPDYVREKWGRFASLILKKGEAFGMRYANCAIAISRTIQTAVEREYGCTPSLIPNGVDLPEMPTSTSHLATFGLEPARYILIVSRIVPEKRHEDLIEAFGIAKLPGWKLAIVGCADHPGLHSDKVARAANTNPNVVMTGFQTGEALRQLYAHAGLFVLPSSHEGLPIALLEALSYGLSVLSSDIPPHLELRLSAERYFPVHDVGELANAMIRLTARPLSLEERTSIRKWVLQRYNWDKVAQLTLEAYIQAMI